eukprot:255005-Prymnesium_polylepis.3
MCIRDRRCLLGGFARGSGAPPNGHETGSHFTHPGLPCAVQEGAVRAVDARARLRFFSGDHPRAARRATAGARDRRCPR